MYGLLALLFSLVLFFNANGSNLQNGLITPGSYEETLTEVPVQTTYDSEKYFIQVYEPTVTVKLASVNRVQLNAETNAETRNFRIVADLNKLKTGTHDVPLEVQNISNSVTASVNPKIFTVTIEKKVTRTYPVEIDFSKENLQDGFQLDKIVAEPSEVTIVTGDQTIKEISKVVAELDELQGITDDTVREVPVYAVNDTGEILRAEIQPETVEVQVQTSAPQKTVSLYASQTGTKAANISHFDFHMNPVRATITGGQSFLDGVDMIAVPVDVTNIHDKTQRVYDIPAADGLSVQPAQVTIEVTPVFSESNSNETQGTTPSSAAVSSEQPAVSVEESLSTAPVSSEEISAERLVESESTALPVEASQAVSSNEEQEVE